VTNNQFRKYNLLWQAGTDPLQIEFRIIQKWNQFKNTTKTSLYHHYKQAQTLLWPEDDWHRWSELALQTFVENTLTTLMGPSDCGKTYPSAKFALMEYWVDPERTLVLVSSTDVRGLELRVWGAIKDLFNRARDRYPWLDGVVLESMHCITTDEVDEEKARVLRKGIICIPCMQGGKYVGLGKYVGIKQARLRQIGDEVQLMQPSFLDAIPNYLGKDYKGVFLGNPIETLDPLGRLAEPECGWDTLPEPTKTTVWKTRFHGGLCVNFVGTDSPNFDFPKDQPVRYPYLISYKKIEAVEQFWGPDWLQYYSQCKGVMKQGLVGRRVITRELCRQHRAHDKAVWLGDATTRVYGCDPAYGGNDRCVGIEIEFGTDLFGTQVVKVSNPEIIPVSVITNVTPEDQIAIFLKSRLEAGGIPSENCFYDSFGKGTLGYAFSRHFSGKSPIPVDFGARPTARPVRHDLYIEDDGEQRLKRCDEHFSKFVTELWFCVRYIIECDQMRELPEDVMIEGTLREYCLVRGNKIEIESKDDTRERMGRSPDLFDALAVAVEGARQRGFKIQKLGAQLVEGGENFWAADDQEEYHDAIKDNLLTHA